MTTTREVPQVVQDLTAVRDLLDNEGWVSQMWKDGGGKRCIGQAIYDALGYSRAGDMSDPRIQAVVGTLTDEIRKRGLGYGRSFDDLVRWNDAGWRTCFEVLNLLDCAITSALGAPQLAEVANG